MKARGGNRHAVVALVLGLLFLVAAVAVVVADAKKPRHYHKQAPAQSTTTVTRPSGGSSFYGGIAIGDVGSPDGDVGTTEPLDPVAKCEYVDWLVEIGAGACSGVLIAPKFVLTTAGCVQVHQEAESVQFWMLQDHKDVSVTIPIRRVKLQATMLKTSSSGGTPEAGFAVLELAEDAPVRPVALESSAESWKTAVEKTRQEESGVRVYGALRTQNGGERQRGGVFAVDVVQECSSQSNLICVTANETCEALHGSIARAPVFLVLQSREDQDARLIGVGLPGSVSGCRDFENERMSTNQFVPVASLEEFLGRNSVDHRWTSPPPPSPGATDGSIEVNNNSSSDSTSDNSDTGEDPGTQEPVPSDWSLQLGHLRVGSEETDTLKGPPVVLIAPRFALTRAQWLDESRLTENSASQILLAAFESEAIPVKKLIFQKDPQSQGHVKDNDELVVLELEYDATVAPISILAPDLQLDVVSPSVEVVVLDEVAAPDDSLSIPPRAAINDVSLSVCSSTAEDQSSLEHVCANVPQLKGRGAPPSALNRGMLIVNGYLVGFSASTTVVSPSASDRYERYPFTRLSSKRQAEFLAKATEATVVWEAKPSRSYWASGDFPSFIARFAASGEDAKPVSCQGMLVAPKFVLTTASCALENLISEIIFQLGDDDPPIHVPYSPQMAIPHPKYNSSAHGDERYDIAILPLEFATVVTPVTLSLGAVNHTYDDLCSFSFPRQPSATDKLFASASSYSRVAFNRSEKCATRASNNSTSAVRLATSVCVTASRVNPPVILEKFHSSPAPSAGTDDARGNDVENPNVGDPDLPPPSSLIGPGVPNPNPPPLPSLVGSVIGKQLNNSKFSVVGFAVTEDAEDADVYSIATVADYAVFINAYVVGSSWESGGLAVDGPIQTPKRYIVGLRVSKSGQNFCGGSLIAPTFVLTAAHCITDGLANWVSVGAKSSSGSDTEAIPILKDSIVIHRQYGNPSKFSFDAAIFEIKTAAYADPVVLDTSPDFSGGERATMYGYGVMAHTQSSTDSEEESLSSEIRAVDLSLLSQAQCAKTLPDIDNSMLCAVGENGADACKGDSGGPLVVPDGQSSSNGDVLVGFVSSGYDCGLKNVPGIYMRVSSLANFIKRNTVGAEWSAPVSTQPLLPTPAMTTSPPLLSPSAASEVRDLDDLTPRESDMSATPSATTTTTTAISVATGQSTQPNENSPITFEDLPKDLAPQVRHAVLKFLLGLFDSSDFISVELLERLASEANGIRFFSSGDLSKLLETITRHNAKPFYARRDRFNRQKSGAAALTTESVNAGVSATTVCTP